MTTPNISMISSGGQPVDLAAMQEFMTATLAAIQDAELSDVEAALQEKGRRMRALLSREALPALSEEQLRGLLRAVFATRRRAPEILAQVGAAPLRDAIGHLLYDAAPVEARFQQFVDSLSGWFQDVRVLRPRKSSDSRASQSAEQSALTENVFCDLASELLHFTDPQQHWLWTRWMWEPRAGTGALPLVTMEECDLHGRTVGETYVKVGVTIAFVRATGDAAGMRSVGAGDYGIDVFLACVYAVYMYTTLRLRMTQEFNKVVPPLPDLIRRLLGVYH
ncbi:hypothetical protein K2Z83_24950 [Oscillochloris sp. ZM17-4]|uniref:hypothetical protein n=1 Tax=Oscillochloris sp. ZM17-4 TaxID=2866714 RepID=UPI001C73C858|nr:hypothetical protein [Oscillochloris sp. ZM17-4]MBX0330910.1 hypothetical protein [Oscillochloris sp. ZM17-4]